MKLQLFDDNGVNDIELNVLMPIDTIFAHEFGIYQITSADPFCYCAERLKSHLYASLFFKLSNEIEQEVTLTDKGFIEVFNFKNSIFSVIESINYDRFNIKNTGKNLIIS